LTKLESKHQTLHIETDALEFPMSELKEQVNALGHLDLVVSRIPIHILQDLQMGLLQDIKSRGEEA